MYICVIATVLLSVFVRPDAVQHQRLPTGRVPAASRLGAAEFIHHSGAAVCLQGSSGMLWDDETGTSYVDHVLIVW